MKVTFLTGPRRTTPRIGDKRVIRGVVHVRVFRMARDGRGRVIGYDCTGGRQRYDWTPVAQQTGDRQ